MILVKIWEFFFIQKLKTRQALLDQLNHDPKNKLHKADNCSKNTLMANARFPFKIQ
jgi:hypothetical protein